MFDNENAFHRNNCGNCKFYVVICQAQNVKLTIQMAFQ